MITSNTPETQLILASSSVYRSAQLTQAGIQHDVVSPNIDEQSIEGETPADLASRLAATKCAKVAEDFATHVLIAGDQVGEIDGIELGKPGNLETALERLIECQGKTALFHSACTVFDPTSQQFDTQCTTTQLKFRLHKPADLKRYLEVDQPFDCAGGFKIEKAGPFLFEYVRSDDPTALIGLPMITLFQQLQKIDYHPFA